MSFSAAGRRASSSCKGSQHSNAGHQGYMGRETWENRHASLEPQHCESREDVPRFGAGPVPETEALTGPLIILCLWVYLWGPAKGSTVDAGSNYHINWHLSTSKLLGKPLAR